ncbi:hypothetical protein HDV00_000608 [Rhizophlyctis rosea]|nr:hypothetical protein HDV00_000608 [Rhizophlyctis rosea]
MTGPEYITKVAIIGASGNSGSFMTDALLATGKHTITAITRADSKATFANGVLVARVDYAKPETLVEALRGHEALIITLGARGVDHDLEFKIVAAAGEAGVEYIIPNDWSTDTGNEELMKDMFLFVPKGENSPGVVSLIQFTDTVITTVKLREAIKELGKSKYISIATGFWYEWSLAFEGAYGFNFKDRHVTFFNKGENKITTSTWPQVGRAVASLLSLPKTGPNSLSTYANTIVYISSFRISQKDMFESVLRVTNTTESDWKITYQDARERFNHALANMKTDHNEFAKWMYSRHFFDDGFGDVTGKGLANKALGLPEDEDLDEATRRGIERSANPWGQ